MYMTVTCFTCFQIKFLFWIFFCVAHSIRKIILSAMGHQIDWASDNEWHVWWRLEKDGNDLLRMWNVDLSKRGFTDRQSCLKFIITTCQRHTDHFLKWSMTGRKLVMRKMCWHEFRSKILSSLSFLDLNTRH